MTDRQTLTRKAKELRALLTEIEAAGYFSVEGVITGAMIDELYKTHWNEKEREDRPPKDLTAARIWLAVRRLQQQGFPEMDNRGRMGDVDPMLALPDWLKSDDPKHRKKQMILIQQISDFNKDGLQFPLTLTLEEIDFIIKNLKKRGFGQSGLPVTDIYEQGRKISKDAADTYDPTTSDWKVDPVFDLTHYAISARHKAMNQSWSTDARHIVYTAWFMQLKQPNQNVEELFLYRGKFVIRPETTDAGTVLLRTCHLQNTFSTHGMPVRHEGLMFETGDKHVVFGFSQDDVGNHTPQTMQLDGLNRLRKQGAVYNALAGWKATTDQFEDVRRDGVLGTGIYMELDTETNTVARESDTLDDFLSELIRPEFNYCVKVERANMKQMSGPLTVTTTVDHKSEQIADNVDPFANTEEREAVVKLCNYNAWTLEDISTLIKTIHAT
ncbi:MAG: hypothetical protein ACFB6R_11450 [Alphaproteobacteria bacterium]